MNHDLRGFDVVLRLNFPVGVMIFPRSNAAFTTSTSLQKVR